MLVCMCDVKPGWNSRLVVKRGDFRALMTMSDHCGFPEEKSPGPALSPLPGLEKGPWHCVSV